MAPSLGRHESRKRDLRKVDPRTPTQDSGDSQPAELRTLGRLHMAGQEGFEPPTPGFGVRCSAVRATGLYKIPGSGFWVSGCCTLRHQHETRNSKLETLYFASLWGVCLRHQRQNFFSSILSGVFCLFFFVE